MTEEIIIDGVNVSECCFYNNGKCDNPNGTACNCINNAVCYFKELKRLEQENKELKERIESQKGLITVGGKQQYEYLQRIDELEQENRELKIVKEQLKKWNDENLKRQDDMQLWIDLAEEQRRKYRFALEEIREIAEDVESASSIRFYRIKNKINEVLNDN